MIGHTGHRRDIMIYRKGAKLSCGCAAACYQANAAGGTAAYKGENIMGNEESIAQLNNNALFRRQLPEEYKILLSSIENESNDLKRIRGVYGLRERSTFNFFEPLDKYWREDFHEVILLQILNPNTKEIGNIAYLRKFTDLLHSINGNYDQNNEFDKDVTVESQRGDQAHGYIDILISDNNRAIIVESKINGAVDQENQLARYYRYVTGVLKKEVMAVVYLRPVNDENKMPPLDGYSDEYKEEVSCIEKLLIPVSVVDSNNQPDLCHGFLDICYEIADTDKAKIYIMQYSELLKTLGGNKMTMNIEKEMFKKLFGDTDSIEKTSTIGEIWDRRWLILGSLIQDALVREQGFNPDGERYSYKNITKKLSLAFIYDPDNKKLGGDYLFGISFDSISQKTKKNLEDILAGIDFKSSPGESLSENVETIENWLLARRLGLNIDKPADKLINGILNMYAQLEEKVNSANII
jgi:hypothetical protein